MRRSILASFTSAAILVMGLDALCFAQVIRPEETQDHALPDGLEATASKPAIIQAHGTQLPWLGFDVMRTDEVVRAQLPKLPKGIGFVVAGVDAKGPAALAGIQQLDVVWKFNDQLLVNEAQFAVLLQLQKIGDRVQISLFRAGDEKIIPVVLGSAPQSRAIVAGPTIESIKTPAQVPKMAPFRPLDVNSRIARLEDGDAVLEMENRAEGLWLTIINQEGNEVFADFLLPHTEKKIPEMWHDRVTALKISLQGRMRHDCRSENLERDQPAKEAATPRVVKPAAQP